MRNPRHKEAEMIVAVIGSEGAVGKPFSVHLEELGHTVLRVDRNLPSTNLEESARQADAVFIFTLPIKEVGTLVDSALDVMREHTLLVHGTSIEHPRSSDILGKGAAQKAAERKITTAHLHFQFRPETPLSSTMLGQSVTLHMEGDLKRWKAFLEEELLKPYAPLLLNLKKGEHDSITKISQVTPMVVAYMVASVWKHFTSKKMAIVLKGLNIGGPPALLIKLATLRTAQAPAVSANILCEHPATLDVLKVMETAIADIRRAIRENSPDNLLSKLDYARDMLKPEELSHLDGDSARLARLNSDLAGPHYKFVFRPELNETGLLAKILKEFDDRDIDKTSTIAQKQPDGGCIIIVGIREFSPKSEEAAEQVRHWLG